MTALQCSALIDEASKEDFVEEIREEYDEVRDEHYDSLKVQKYSLNMFNGLLRFCQVILGDKSWLVLCREGILHGNESQSMIG